MQRFFRNTKRLTLLIPLLVSLPLWIDILDDWHRAQNLAHFMRAITTEVITLAIMAGILLRYLALQKNLNHKTQELNKTQELLKWAQTQHKSLGDIIDRQLLKWNLSKAEQDIAHLLLKGLGLKEIAQLRSTSERTVRQQVQAIYSKSGLSGRSEFAAYFLEDVLGQR